MVKTKRDFLSGYKTYTGERGSPAEWRAAFNDTMGFDEAQARVGKQSPWQILGVAISATWAQVVTAYRAAVSAVHPDRCAYHGLTPEAATERTKQVLAAFTVLKVKYKK